MANEDIQQGSDQCGKVKAITYEPIQAKIPCDLRAIVYVKITEAHAVYNAFEAFIRQWD